MSELRPYQVTAIDSALAALSNSGSAVLQMPTGAGKTRAATEIVKGAEGPVWFVCHRQEIERQAAKAFAAAGIDFGIVSPRGAPEYDKPVQIVSVGTLARRIADLPAPKMVAWDECHHIPAKSWAEIREQLADAKHLGLTATPERLDGKGLSGWFAELVTGPTTRELIDAGYLSDFRYFAPSDPDLSAAKMQAGDYRKADLAKVMNTPVLIGDAVAEYLKSAAGKRALVFCASVEASRALVERFNAEGVPALHVDGTTPATERDDAVEALTSGAVKVLSNVEVFTEGFDLPAIDVVILLRPTKSLALFLQMVGRALRRAEGKTEALIFDHAGLWLDHGWFDLPVAWSLDGGARKRRLAGMVRGPRRCPECKEVRVERALVCDCGYEFPTGREIGEYDGALQEVRTSDLIRVNTLTKRAGFNSSSSYYFVKAGIPCRKIGGNYFTTQREFDEWIRDTGRKPYDGSPAFERGPASSRGLVTVNGFSRKHGVSSFWVRKYIPQSIYSLDVRGAGKQRFLLSDEAEKWISEIISKDGKLIRLADVCNSREVRKSLKEHGLKFVTKGMCTFTEFENAMKKREAVLRRNNPPVGYANKTQFANLIGHKQRTGVRKMILKGLEVRDDGLIHIQRGLEWVRDNTSIQIPPEAWPSANDNGAAADSAAA